MIATAFDEENCVLDPPPGKTQEEVFSLSVFRGTNSDGEPVVVSCWKPTIEEWEEMRKTGRVWLVLMGQTMQPAYLTGVSPFAGK